MSRRDRVDWRQFDRLLGKLPDEEIARRVGTSPSGVLHRRRRLRIRRVPRRSPDWLKIDPLLGTRPDREIARLAGCSPHKVLCRRAGLGISPFPRPRAGASRAVEIDWRRVDRLLGRVPDFKIARRFGLMRGAVQCRRQAKGIRPYIWQRDKRRVRSPRVS